MESILAALQGHRARVRGRRRRHQGRPRHHRPAHQRDQLQHPAPEKNGRFHSLLKRDLDEVKVLKKSLMPENFAELLTVKELHDSVRLPDDAGMTQRITLDPSGRNG